MSICEVIEVQKQQEAKFLCSACGAERGCNCNAPAVPKAQQAIEAIKANPEKSDRAIAADIGVSQPTVSKARKEVETTDKQLSVEARTGLDGKTRKVPRHVTGNDVDAEASAEDRKREAGASQERENARDVELDVGSEPSGRDGKTRKMPTRKPSEQKPDAPHASPRVCMEDELCVALDEADAAAKEIKKHELNGDSATFLLFCLNSHLAAINKVVTAIEKKYRKKLRLFQEEVAAEKAKQAKTEKPTRPGNDVPTDGAVVPKREEAPDPAPQTRAAGNDGRVYPARQKAPEKATAAVEPTVPRSVPVANGNSVDTGASAEAMKAKHNAADGSIPAFLRRVQ